MWSCVGPMRSCEQGRRPAREHFPHFLLRDDPKPFSQQIMDEPVPPIYITPKITLFTGVDDLENHLKEFRAQMILSGGLTQFNVRCS